MSSKLKIETEIKDIKSGFENIADNIKDIDPKGMSAESLKEGAELCDDINKLTTKGRELKGSVQELKQVFENPEFDNSPEIKQEQKQDLTNKNKNRNRNTLRNTMGREEG